MPRIHPVRPRYTARATTGILAATLAADSAVFAMRNGTSGDAHIYRISVSFAATVSFTAASQVLFHGDRFDTATHTGGTAYTELAHESAGASTMADIRAATTAALTDTSVVYDGTPIPLVGAGGPAAGTVYPGLDLDLRDGPIVLAESQGFAIINTILWPAAGTGVLQAVVSWY